MVQYSFEFPLNTCLHPQLVSCFQGTVFDFFLPGSNMTHQLPGYCRDHSVTWETSGLFVAAALLIQAGSLVCLLGSHLTLWTRAVLPHKLNPLNVSLSQRNTATLPHSLWFIRVSLPRFWATQKDLSIILLLPIQYYSRSKLVRALHLHAQAHRHTDLCINFQGCVGWCTDSWCGAEEAYTVVLCLRIDVHVSLLCSQVFWLRLIFQLCLLMMLTAVELVKVLFIKFKISNCNAICQRSDILEEKLCQLTAAMGDLVSVLLWIVHTFCVHVSP